MNKTLLKGIAAAAVIGAGLMMPTSHAAADSFRISVGTPHVGVSYKHYDGHRRHHHDRHYDHHRSHRSVKVYRGRHYELGRRHHHGHVRVYRYEPPKHVCRYEKRPVTKVYYDECGTRVYYTAYETVKLCESYHRHH